MELRTSISGGSSNHQLKTKLRQFVAASSGISNHSFGEIKFEQVGRKSTYSPFVTVSAQTKPSVIWNLFTNQWKIHIPNIILIIAGNGQAKESLWQLVSEGSWIITTGCSPFSGTSSANSIAVIGMETVHNKDVLYTSKQGGLFPIVYKLDAVGSKGLLDRNHGYFVFVEGEPKDVSLFRHELSNYMGSIPVDVDSTFTVFHTIPVVVNLISDNWEHISECARRNQTMMLFVHESAKKTYDLLEKNMAMKTGERSGESSDNEEDLSYNITDCLSHYEISQIKLLLQGSKKTMPIMFSDAIKGRTFDDFLLGNVMSEPRYSTRAILRLALSWGKMDIIKQLLRTKIEFSAPEPEFLQSCLMMALGYNSPEFLDMMHTGNIDIYRAITVKTLSQMYYQIMAFDDFTTTPSMRFFRTFLATTRGEVANVIHKVQHIISDFTNKEVQDIYEKYTDGVIPTPKLTRIDRLTTVYVAEHFEPVDHPIQDVFIWCVIMGRNELAKTVWLHGTDHIALALLASTLYGNIAQQMSESNEDMITIEELYNYARFWEEKAIEVVTLTYKKHELTTRSILCSKIPHLGGFSCLTLAYMGVKRNFMAQPSVQRSLDTIWYGNLSLEQPMYKTILGIFCPFCIPWLNIVREDSSNYGDQKRFSPKFSKESQASYREKHGQSISENGTLSDLFQRSSTTDTLRIKQSLPRRFLGALDDIRGFYDSPRITYFTHTSFLVVAIILLSYVLHFVNAERLNIYWTEIIILLFYVCGILADEIRQIASVDNKSYLKRISTWLSDRWNMLDIMMIVSFAVGTGILCSGQTDNSVWYTGKLALCVSLVGLYTRLAQTYITSKYFGPKVYMIAQMMHDTGVFLGLMGMIFFCYGVIIRSLTSDIMPSIGTNYSTHCIFGNVVNGTCRQTFQSTVVKVFNAILLDPYWQIYGNNLDAVQVPQRHFSGIIRFICAASYVLFTNILMVNLLIAMYSFTFDNIQGHTHTIWCYYRYEVVREFSSRPFLPSPLILINHIIALVRVLCGKGYSKSAFKIDISVEQSNFNSDFEHTVVVELNEENIRNEANKKTMGEKFGERQIAMEYKLNEALLLLKKLNDDYKRKCRSLKFKQVK